MNYQEIDAANQSLIKALYYKGLSALRQKEPELFYEEKEHFLLGNMFDTIMTDPSNFRKKFYVSEIDSKPSPTLMSIINKAFALRKDNIFHYNDPKFLQYMDEEGWHVGKGEKRLTYKAWLESNVREYWNALVESEGKETVTIEEYEKVMNASQKVMESIPFVTMIPELNVHNQLSLEATYTLDKDTKIPIKGLLDQVIFRDENDSKWDEICESLQIENNHDAIIIDYKTFSGLSMKYRYSIRKFRYDVQASFYQLLLEENYANYLQIGNMPVKELYKVAVVNVVANLNIDEPSFVWKYSQEDLDIGEFGAWHTTPHEYHIADPYHINDLDIDEVDIPGFRQMLQRYHWYKMNNFETEYGFENNILNNNAWNY